MEKIQSKATKITKLSTEKRKLNRWINCSFEAEEVEVVQMLCMGHWLYARWSAVCLTKYLISFPLLCSEVGGIVPSLMDEEIELQWS